MARRILRVRCGLRIVGLVGLMMLGGVMAAQQTDVVVAAKQQYGEMKARLTGGDMSLDWRAFRVSAATAGLTRGFVRREDYDQALLDTDAGRLQKGLDAANAAIDRNMADPEAHLLAARVLDAMSRGNEAAQERAIEMALVGSIFASGDGSGAGKAFFVVDRGEEIFFIHTAQGEEPTAHEAVTVGAQSFDKVTTVDWAGTKRELWFSVELTGEFKERASQ